MKRLENIWFFAMICIFCAGLVRAGSEEEAWAELVGKKFMERPEFTFVKNNPDLPNVLIYGDSISMGYTPRVQEQLKGTANVYRIYCNGGDTARVIPAMMAMHEAMAEYWNFTWDVIHFNAGLHDLKYLDENRKYDTENGTQVRSPEEYGKNLREIIAYFRETAPRAKIIFATTTPVPENSRGRKAGDAVRFNEAALDVLKDYPEIEINDLYRFTQTNYAQWQRRPGDVHYNADGSAAQGDEVAKAIASVLPPEEPPGAASGIAELLSNLNPDAPGMEQVKSASATPRMAAEKLLKYYRSRDSVKHPVGRYSEAEMSGQVASAEDIQTADNALKHIFVGQPQYPPFFCGDDIDWSTRPVPDTEWVWQLNRMGFWDAMGRAYWHTGDEKYAEEWCVQVVDWVKKIRATISTCTRGAPSRPVSAENAGPVFFSDLSIRQPSPPRFLSLSSTAAMITQRF